jgi:ABC-type branched-subunit amino acid transport system substrate-binding protein
MKYLIILAFLFISGCSNVSVIRPGEESGAPVDYGNEYLSKITKIKETFKQGKHDQAVKELIAMSDSSMNEAQRAMRKNLLGVFYFQLKKYDLAIASFQAAKELAKIDMTLYQQVLINNSSTFFKLNNLTAANQNLNEIDMKYLVREEQEKYFLLMLNIGKKLQLKNQVMIAQAYLLSRKVTIGEMKSDVLYGELTQSFAELSFSEKLTFLNSFTGAMPSMTGLLAFLQAEKEYYAGNRSGAKDLISWSDEKFNENFEIKQLFEGLQFRMQNFAKIQPRNMGVLFPLSGDREQYGNKTFAGLEFSLKEAKAQNESFQDLVLYSRDTKGSPTVAADSVRELVEKYNVSVIIGGLYSDEATRIYLECKKYGVFFISLASVYLPAVEKDFLLIEIPGSIESQLNIVFSQEYLKKFGNNAGLIYSNDQAGKSYADEFWRRSQIFNVDVVAVQTIEKNKSEYMDEVKKFLGLKFPRARAEELHILNNVFAGAKNIRRVNELTPDADFGWVFMPLAPKDAMKMIPLFGYFDAAQVNFFGNSLWRSEILRGEAHSMTRNYFIADILSFDEEAMADQPFVQKFTTDYGYAPKLLEMRGYDAFNLFKEIFTIASDDSRDVFNEKIRGHDKFSGLTGSWSLTDGLWLKNMALYKITKDKFEMVK